MSQVKKETARVDEFGWVGSGAQEMCTDLGSDQRSSFGTAGAKIQDWIFLILKNYVRYPPQPF